MYKIHANVHARKHTHKKIEIQYIISPKVFFMRFQNVPLVTGEMKKDKGNKIQTCTLYFCFLVIVWDAGSEAYSPIA